MARVSRTELLRSIVALQAEQVVLINELNRAVLIMADTIEFAWEAIGRPAMERASCLPSDATP